MKWTRKTTRALAEELRKKKYEVGHSTIPRLAKKLGYTLKKNRKRLSRKQDEKRDEQIKYLTCQRKRFVDKKQPVISVDGKKKELIGQFRNPGRTLRKEAVDVLETDFPSDAKGKAIPYGIYDVHQNQGYMVIGISHETSAFAISSIRSWWLEIGQKKYKGRITMTHFPAGASKWNLIEHRMFSVISSNWAGQPLDRYETMLKFIRTSKTITGFRCLARFDRRKYQTGLKIEPTEKKKLNIHFHRRFPHWNYTIKPHPI